ncbi:glycosyl hydrolases family 31-domain-containing protein [Pilobolus umbonatus]|nr:glycosyl hydrolases family 31-domain-containing protein [Pilobolus umbonatus]
MWGSLKKASVFSSPEEYVEPRLSIASTVSIQEFSTEHFKIQVDAQHVSLVVKNMTGKIIWKSLQNQPFLASSLGVDEIQASENGTIKITENDDQFTRIQTITFIERIDESTIQLKGGLGAKLVLPTHMDYVFTFKEINHRQLQFWAEITHRDVSMENYKRLLMIYESRLEEQFYGFGEQFSSPSLKGQKVSIFVREPGAGRGATAATSIKDSALGMFGSYGPADITATYASIPQYITSDIRCLFMENSEYMSFDLSKPDRVTIRIESDKIKGRILDGKTMLDLITEYTSYAGRMLPLPDWVSEGVIAGIGGGEAKVRNIIQKLRENDVPIAAVWINDWTGSRTLETGKGGQYVSQWWNWEHDEGLYSDWSKFVESLNNDNKGRIRTLSYINPLLSSVENKSQFKRNLFNEAKHKNYLVQNASSFSSESKALLFKYGTNTAGLLDLTNPEACIWFKEILKEQVWKSKISGIMIDLGEQLPCDNKKVMLHSGELASSYHNHYPEAWAQLNKEVMFELNQEKEAVCSLRSAYTQSPGHTNLFWAGDQNITWDQQHGIKSAVNGMLSGGFSGLAVTHCDIGGYNTVTSMIPGFGMMRSKELLFRWMELAAFTSAFRTNEGSLPSLNAQFYTDQDTYSHFAHTAKLFTLLSVYRKSVLKEAYEKGWPVMRHPILYYPNDKTVRELTYQQFLLGNCILVAPVLNPSAGYVKVYFPKDAQNITWRHIWSGRYFPSDGSYKSVDAPLGQPAVFIKEPRGDGGVLNELLDYATTYYQQKTRPSIK